MCCTNVQQCSVGLDKQAGPDELVIVTSYTNTSTMWQIIPRHCLIEQELLQDKQGNFVFSDSSVNDNISGDVMSYKDECGQGDCLVVDEMVQASKDDDFVVNCITVQETFSQSDNCIVVYSKSVCSAMSKGSLCQI